MANWTYRCYDDGTTPSFWQRWYDDTPQARGSHNAAFGILEQLEVWSPPNFKPLKGEYKGLHEVKFLGKDQRQWRVFGKADQRNQSFLALHIGYHKDSNYTPSNVMAKAKERLAEALSDPRKAKPCERPGK
ncbi:hypothetical protein EOB36_25655 [Mesorhizobium sp. M6A.T.Cr.TU.017.01.1.1]|nr:hypothetical protein EOB36_25655 [Mesorhizobium sp. M6A.T.Cr.TU.017.01.1.1]